MSGLIDRHRSLSLILIKDRESKTRKEASIRRYESVRTSETGAGAKQLLLVLTHCSPSAVQ